MRLIGLLIMIFLLPRGSEAHPLHISITNITYENGKLMISMKTFIDDWETAYFHYHSKPIDFSDPRQRAKPWLKEYLNNRFKISLNENDTNFSLELDTIVIGEDAMIIEMQCTIPAKPNSLYIYNAFLTDIYPDQTNLVILGFKKREIGIKFDVKKYDEEVLLK